MAAGEDDEVVKKEEDPGRGLVDGEDHGAPGASDVVDLLDHAVSASGVQAGCWLVEEEEGRPVDDVNADRDSPPLAAGDSSGPLVAYVGVSSRLHDRL